MKYLMNLLVGIFCELVALLLIRIFILGERDNIIEIGYRSQSKKHKIPPQKLPVWDRIIHWSLCKEAKVKTKGVWIYFTCNLYLVVAAVISAVYACILVMFYETKEVLLYLLEYFMLVFMIWISIHFVLDLIYLPSEQKRYGIHKKHKQ